ncbi:protein Nazo-like [Drosophila tropicalis]|uniref:protein Nazo-like n=1 Tax=Drosophila tropicalis TaxID=46794 RepID=UPI0035ABDBAE
MPIDTEELIEAIAVLVDNNQIRATFEESAKGAAVVGITTLLGGLLLGPRGLALGGVVGGAVAYAMADDSFRPLGEIILNDLTDTQREQLVQHVTKAVQDVHPTDLAMLLPLIMSNVPVQLTVLNTVKSFAQTNLKLNIID